MKAIAVFLVVFGFSNAAKALGDSQCGHVGSTDAMLDCMEGAYKESVAALNSKVDQINQGLETLEAKNRLKIAEDAWASDRDAGCNMEAAYLAGDVLEHVIVQDCTIKKNIARLKELDRLAKVAAQYREIL